VHHAAPVQPHGVDVPARALDDATRKDIGAFYGEMFGWSGFDVELFDQTNFLLAGDDGSQHFILLAEADKPMSSPGYDHLGILCDTREEVDELLERARRWREKDDRVKILEFKDDLVQGPSGGGGGGGVGPGRRPRGGVGGRGVWGGDT
jgi:hypothetical protein